MTYDDQFAQLEKQAQYTSERESVSYSSIFEWVYVTHYLRDNIGNKRVYVVQREEKSRQMTRDDALWTKHKQTERVVHAI